MIENEGNANRPRAARRAALAELFRLLRVAPLPRWATPLLIALGLAASLAETVGITLVLLFFYLAMGQVELATSTSGLLGDALRQATSWFHGSTETAFVVLVLIVARGALSFANTLISARVGEQINEVARTRVHLQYLSASYSFLQRHDEAYLMEVLGTETWLISGAYSSLTRIIVSSCSIFLFVSFLFALSVKITVTAIAASMIISAGLRYLARPMQELGSGVKQVHQRLGEHMLMTIQGMRTIRAYGQEDVHQDRFERASTDARRVALGLARLSALVSPLTEVGYLMVLCLVIASADLWGIGFATSLTAVALLYRLQPHMRELETSLLYMAQIEPQLRSIRLMLSTDDKEYPKHGQFAISKLSDRISFRKVTFRYDSRSDPALDDVSFDIPAGKVTALIGASDHRQRKVGWLNALRRDHQCAAVRPVPRAAGPALGCIYAGIVFGPVVGELPGKRRRHRCGYGVCRLEPCRSRLIVGGTIDRGHLLLGLGSGSGGPAAAGQAPGDAGRELQGGPHRRIANHRRTIRNASPCSRRDRARRGDGVSESSGLGGIGSIGDELPGILGGAKHQRPLDVRSHRTRAIDDLQHTA